MARNLGWQENRNQAIFEREQAAEARAAARRRGFVQRNPGAVAPQDRRQALFGDAEVMGKAGRAMWNERRMQELKNKGDVLVAHEKRMGMENQGLGAAKLRYGYMGEDGLRVQGSEELTEAERRMGQENVAKIQGENAVKLEEERGKNALSVEEMKWAGQKDVEEVGLKRSELEWGGTNPDGTRKAGGRESVSEIEGKARVDAAKAQAEAAAQEAEAKRALEEQKRLAEKERFEKNLKYKYERLDEQTRKSVDTQANALAKEKRISFEEARAQVMASREQSGGKKEVKRQRNAATGEIRIVYDDGSTEIVKG